MFLILAIEPDRRQANRLAAIARGPIRNAELVTVDTVEAGLEVLGRHVPDLVLTSMLLSAKDDAALAERLRELDTAGRQVQTLVIPLFAAPRRNGDGGLLARFTRSDEGPSQGCQPAVFAAQINEYLEHLQLEREAREMRQPYSAQAETLYKQPTVTDPYREIVAPAPTRQVIVPPPAHAKEPARIAAPSPAQAARPIEPARAPGPPRIADQPRSALLPRPVEPTRTVEPPRIGQPARISEPAATFEPAAAPDAPTAEPPRLIAPSPIVEPRASATQRSRTESLGVSADAEGGAPVAEPARLIAPSPVAEPLRAAPPAAEAELPRPPAGLTAPPSPPAAPAKAKPKIAKVRFVPPPLHEDPEVAKFMAALNELPTVAVVGPAVECDAEAASPAAIAAVSLELDLDAKPSAMPSHEAAAAIDPPRETPLAPKTVKALKPARARAISPAAAPPPRPAAGARKRVTPIRRSASAPAQPEPTPEAPPGSDETPTALSGPPVKVVGRIQPASAVPAAPAAARTGKQRASRRPRPVQDEWGLFDPDQAGLPAVQAALEEIEEPDIFRHISTPPKSRS